MIFFSLSSLSQISAEDRNSLSVNVTRTPTSESDLAPFKVVTRTRMPQFRKEFYEVYRGAGDFQWLHDILVEACPERIVPPLRSTISLDGKKKQATPHSCHCTGLFCFDLLCFDFFCCFYL